MQIKIDDDFIRIDLILTRIIGFNWLEIIGEEKYYSLQEYSDEAIIKEMQL